MSSTNLKPLFLFVGAEGITSSTPGSRVLEAKFHWYVMSLGSTCFGSSACRPFKFSSNGVKDETQKRPDVVTLCYTIKIQSRHQISRITKCETNYLCKPSCPEFILIFFCASVLMLALLLLLGRLHFTIVHSNVEPKCCDILAIQNMQWFLQTFISWKQSTGISQAHHLHFTPSTDCLHLFFI